LGRTVWQFLHCRKVRKDVHFTGGMSIFLHLYSKLNAILAYAVDNRGPHKKCEKTNKKGVQKTPSHLENIIRPVISQLNTVLCPKFSKPPNKVPHHPRTHYKKS